MTNREPSPQTVAPAQPAAPAELRDRDFLRLEDLVMEPIAFTLSDFGGLPPELQDPLPH